MRILYCGIAILLLSFISQSNDRKVRIFLAGDSTISIKESRAFPETGWGMPFVHFWDSSVLVINKAKNGRSTRTFISEGLWQSIIDQAGKGDYVLIQFGHNDESKEKTERYTTPEQFSSNLTRFVNEARTKGAIPILLTPVSRRRFDSLGNALQTHATYSKLTRQVATTMNTGFIDLDEKSRELYQQFGPEHSRLLFVQLKAGEHPNYPEGRNDNTHFNELGARLVAQIVLSELRKIAPELEDRIIVPIKK